LFPFDATLMPVLKHGVPKGTGFMSDRISDDALSSMFLSARSRNEWCKESLPEQM